MQGLAILVGIVVVVMVGMWILETMVDGLIGGLFRLISAPFNAAGRAREKSKMDKYVNGLYFDTSTPVNHLRGALAQHFNKGDLHPANKVIVQTDEPGIFIIGIAWHEQVEFTMEDGSKAHGSGLPVIVAELTYESRGPRTIGRMRLTRFPHDLGWAESAVMDNIFPWCCAPIYELDPSAVLHEHQDAVRTGIR
ncbi:hypothetical protein [Antrihabitans stalactiti]|uniref:Uncharacterized protein n=1 Tax=Antrihabitans stalactiti TaxID=2584121 RepID=A0A848K7W4_9NOCA|nr:hypothetical protein [Antrihabitans stalactiti]NMN95075.1 hypothetical protein [Antrihabitans stalactiti]